MVRIKGDVEGVGDEAKGMCRLIETGVVDVEAGRKGLDAVVGRCVNAVSLEDLLDDLKLPGAEVEAVQSGRGSKSRRIAGGVVAANITTATPSYLQTNLTSTLAPSALNSTCP